MEQQSEIKITINKPESFPYSFKSNDISSHGNDKEFFIKNLAKAILQDAEYLDHMVEITVTVERKEGE